MANEALPESLRDFLSWSGNALTPQTAWQVYALAREYPAIVPFLQKPERADRITRSYLSGNNEELVSVLHDALTEASVSFSETPVQVRQDLESQQPTAAMDEKTLRDHVEQLEAARTTARQATEAARTKQRATNRKWIENVVTNWTKSIPREQQEQFRKPLSDAVERTVNDRPDLSANQVVNQVFQDMRQQIPPDSMRRMAPGDRVVADVAEIQQYQRQRIDREIAQAVLDSPRPAVAANAIADGISRAAPSHPAFYVSSALRTISRAEDLADRSVAFTVDAETAQGAAPDLSRFFRTVSKSVDSPLQRALSPLADTVMSVFPPETQRAIAARVIGDAGSRQMANGSMLDRVFGGLLSSSAVQKSIRDGNAVFSQAQGAGPTGGAGKIASDVFTSIFRPNVSEVYLEIVYQHSQHTITGFEATSWAQFYLAMGGDVGSRVFSWTAKKAAKKAKKAIAEKAVSATTGTSIGTAIGGLLGGGPFGAAIGNVVGGAVSKLVGGLWDGIKGIGGLLFSGSWIEDLMAGRSPAETGPWFTRVAFMLPFVLLFVILLPILPLGMVFPIMDGPVLHNAIASSAFAIPIGDEYLEAQQGASGASGASGAPGTTCDPLKDPKCAAAACTGGQNCLWPTAGGCITQGPFVPDPNGTHHSMNAIDIGAVHHTDVRATHDGVVVGMENKYADNQFVRGVYGNYVKLEGTDSKGNKFYTIYAHLWVVQVSLGQHVKLGDPLGKTDNNGHSFGEHLHYEYRGGGDISTILPVPVPHCNYGTCPHICW